LKIPWTPHPPYSNFTQQEAIHELTEIANRLEREEAEQLRAKAYLNYLDQEKATLAREANEAALDAAARVRLQHLWYEFQRGRPIDPQADLFTDSAGQLCELVDAIIQSKYRERLDDLPDGEDPDRAFAIELYRRAKDRTNIPSIAADLKAIQQRGSQVLGPLQFRLFRGVMQEILHPERKSEDAGNSEVLTPFGTPQDLLAECEKLRREMDRTCDRAIDNLAHAPETIENLWHSMRLIGGAVPDQPVVPKLSEAKLFAQFLLDDLTYVADVQRAIDAVVKWCVERIKQERQAKGDETETTVSPDPPLVLGSGPIDGQRPIELTFHDLTRTIAFNDDVYAIDHPDAFQFFKLVAEAKGKLVPTKVLRKAISFPKDVSDWLKEHIPCELRKLLHGRRGPGGGYSILLRLPSSEKG
jgi:hypothetical protein